MRERMCDIRFAACLPIAQWLCRAAVKFSYWVHFGAALPAAGLRACVILK